ncbi:MAG: tetratricopeptide repeat protein [archaeon]
MKKAFLIALALILPTLAIGQTFLIQKGITDAKAMLSLGDYLLKNGYDDAALAAYQKGLELDPSDVAILNNMGYYYREKNPLAAESYFKKALEIDEDYELARNNLALLYSNLENYNGAIENLRLLVSKHPDSIAYNYDLAINLANRYYHVTKEYDDLYTALDYFKKVYNMDKNYEHVMENIRVLSEVMDIIGG